MSLNKFIKIRVSEEQKELYYKLAKKEYEGNLSRMIKDLLKKYENEVLEKRG